MENIVALAIPALMTVIAVRAIFIPMKWTLRLALHALCGCVCLWLINTVSGFTGLYLPVNAVTVLLSGTLGVPGMAVIALLEVL